MLKLTIRIVVAAMAAIVSASAAALKRVDLFV
jgi:hypothetical protein